MAGKVIKSRFVLLSKFSANGLESASKTATSHIRKTLSAIFLCKSTLSNFPKLNLTEVPKMDFLKFENRKS